MEEEMDVNNRKVYNVSANQPMVNVTSYDDDDEHFSAYDEEMMEYLDYSAKLDNSKIKSCKCLPSCSSIHYDAEVSQTHLSWREYSQARKIYKEHQDE